MQHPKHHWHQLLFSIRELLTKGGGGGDVGVWGTTMGASFFVLRIAHQLVGWHHHWHQLLFCITKELLMKLWGWCGGGGTTIGTSFFLN